MRVSVIVSTYNSPASLEKVLWGYAVQTHRNFEILVADDGSDQHTSLMIRRVERATSLSIRHVWHADQGFRKATILNRATATSEGEYLVFTDGDCIPRHDFLATHVALARPGRLLSGGCVRLSRQASESIGVDDILARRTGDPRRLGVAGAAGSRGMRILGAGARQAWLLDHITTTRATWNGCNSSTFRRYILEVNGHDERMQYGGLDREMGERLVNMGVRPIQVRHRAVCLHLDHDRPYANPAGFAANLAIRADTRRARSVWTPHGIEQADRFQLQRGAAA
jgi:glycosyltransferase involved in cell wall biosynthesis